ECSQVPLSALSLEEVDGFFCALVVGPEPVMPSEYMPYVWGGDEPAEGPVYDSEAQQHFVLDLFSRYWNAIARRIADDVGHEPFLFAAADRDRGKDWASGFALGVTLREPAWTRLIHHRKAAMLLDAIVALSEDEILPEVRSEIIERLPGLVVAIAGFWLRAGQ